MRRKHVNWLVVLFFVVIISVVFQQIFTSMTEQGIASGGPYDNAAAYPRFVAFLIGLLVFAQMVLDYLGGDKNHGEEQIILTELRRPLFLLVIFSIYLGLLGTLGYHLTTTPMIFAIMFLCGMRRVYFMLLAAFSISISFAFMFEFFLKIVLPGGVFSLNIPW